MVIYSYKLCKGGLNINIVSQKKTYINKKNLPLKYNSRKKHKLRYEKYNSLFIISISIIFITSFITIHNLYINTNCKDLYYSVEYNFTVGFTDKNKLMRVQHMSLISKDNTTAIVEVSGLSKTPPHKNTSFTGNFKKRSNGIWELCSVDN